MLNILPKSFYALHQYSIYAQLRKAEKAGCLPQCYIRQYLRNGICQFLIIRKTQGQ